MADTTTISLRPGTKEVLEAEKREGETWDHLLLRLAGEAEDQEVAALLERVEARLGTLDMDVADELERRFG